RGADGRGARARWPARPDPGRLPRALRAPMRLLHPGDADDRHGPPASLAEPEPGGDPARAGRQHLSLHGLPVDRGRRRGRGGKAPGLGTRRRRLMERPDRLVGQPVKRVEDGRLLVGQGRFVDDLHLPRMLHAAFVRSPHAHARLRRVDVSRAVASHGVVAVLTGDEAARLCRPWRGILTDYVGMKTALQYPLARDKVRYVGEPVVAVAATDRSLAEDACELVRIDYEALPALVDP